MSYQPYYNNTFSQQCQPAPDIQQSTTITRSSNKKQEIEQAADVIQSFIIDDIQVAPVVQSSCLDDMALFNARGYTIGSSPSDQENDQDDLHLLSAVSVLIIELESLVKTIKNDKEIIKKYKKKDDEVNKVDGWEVFRFQIREEYHINKTFDTVNDFLEYWLHEYNKRQESSRLEPIYMKKHTKKQPGQGPTGVQQEASERYQKLSYTDRAIYRAI